MLDKKAMGTQKGTGKRREGIRFALVRVLLNTACA